MAVADTYSTLSPDLDRRFGGLARLYGDEGAKKIRAAHVIVVGLGGVGSWAAEAMARSGIARLTLIDLDHIAESNINRQIHALDTTLGQAKVEAMRDRIAHINADCDVAASKSLWMRTTGLLLPVWIRKRTNRSPSSMPAIRSGQKQRWPLGYCSKTPTVAV